MKNILDFISWKINESVSVSGNNININGEEYKIEGDSVKYKKTRRKAPKAISKYASKLYDASVEAENAEETFELDRVTGGISELKNKIKTNNININVNHKSFNEVIKGLRKFEYTYVKLDKKYNDIFNINGNAIGRGEVLLSVLYNDTRRHSGDEKGDNETLNDKYEIEVKSAGASMPIIKSGVLPKDKKVNEMDYTCAYSIAKYITGRDIGNIYLIIFDNGIQKIQNSNITDNTDDENKMNSETSRESTESSNENGDKKTDGFFIMNCGYTYKPKSNDCETAANKLAKHLVDIISVKNPKNKEYKEWKKFVFEFKYEDNKEKEETKKGKIICTII